MSFVLPIVALVGGFCVGVGSLLAALLPGPLWVRVGLLLAVAVFGGYFAALGLFWHLNPPHPLPAAARLTRRCGEHLLAATGVPCAARTRTRKRH